MTDTETSKIIINIDIKKIADIADELAKNYYNKGWLDLSPQEKARVGMSAWITFLLDWYAESEE